MDEKENSKKKNRKYNEATLKSAIESVLESKFTVYMASKEYNVPSSTLKANIERVKKEREEGIIEIKMLKVGRPFSLPVNLEQSLLSYIIQMQELGFGLTVNQIRQKPSKSSISADDWVCRSCNGLYSRDVKLQNGAEWITCSFCTNPYHIHCQSQIIDDNQAVFLCDICSIDDSSGEE